ncbi:hypothetical protein [Spirosoma oryzicola]|uniref:hypothetical protein n=1 Tax=Spirosoma oryzicola TaxID=2898794 RepID=UPI001E6079CB|nr:hypothetical protein [Spirosoma oryzicola]UHG94616.1 hypothetical protein LQ777_28095 [Spirosoma oryzicola]
MATPTNDRNTQLRQLADYLVSRQETIINQWWTRCSQNEDFQVCSSVSMKDFTDQLPPLLTLFTQSVTGEPHESDHLKRASQYWVKRWQRGYPLAIVLTELDYFYDSLDLEIQQFLERYPQTQPGVIIPFYAQLFRLWKAVNNDITIQFDQLQQATSNEQIQKLQTEINSLHQSTRQRVGLLQHTVHDLRSQFGIISTATTLRQGPLADDERAKLRDMVTRASKTANLLFSKLLADGEEEQARLAPDSE